MKLTSSLFLTLIPLLHLFRRYREGQIDTGYTYLLLKYYDCYRFWFWEVIPVPKHHTMKTT